MSSSDSSSSYSSSSTGENRNNEELFSLSMLRWYVLFMYVIQAALAISSQVIVVKSAEFNEIAYYIPFFISSMLPAVMIGQIISTLTLYPILTFYTDWSAMRLKTSSIKIMFILMGVLYSLVYIGGTGFAAAKLQHKNYGKVPNVVILLLPFGIIFLTTLVITSIKLIRTVMQNKPKLQSMIESKSKALEIYVAWALISTELLLIGWMIYGRIQVGKNPTNLSNYVSYFITSCIHSIIIGIVFAVILMNLIKKEGVLWNLISGRNDAIYRDPNIGKKYSSYSIFALLVLLDYCISVAWTSYMAGLYRNKKVNGNSVLVPIIVPIAISSSVSFLVTMFKYYRDYVKHTKPKNSRPKNVKNVNNVNTSNVSSEPINRDSADLTAQNVQDVQDVQNVQDVQSV